MQKVVIIGHFGFGSKKLSGQTIKTEIVTQELIKKYGADEIGKEDTHGKWRFLIKSPLVVLRALRNGRNVIMMPAYKGIWVITPFLVLFNIFFHRSLFYVVVGGWLPGFLKKHRLFSSFFYSFNQIFVETNMMLTSMQELGLSNVSIMPNFKHLEILSYMDIDSIPTPPYKLCTFSRIIKEKGIEDAIRAVNNCNKILDKTAYTLDIYGQDEQNEWFPKLMKEQPPHISYRGNIPFNKSVEALRNHFALLFPTYYRGEGFAGTLIDAMASGLPVIATKWHANEEFIKDGDNGFTFPVHDVEALTSILLDCYKNPDKILSMRKRQLDKAQEYAPSKAIIVLTDKLN